MASLPCLGLLLLTSIVPTTHHEARLMLVEAHQMLSAIYNGFTEGVDTKDLQKAKALLQELQSQSCAQRTLLCYSTRNRHLRVKRGKKAAPFPVYKSSATRGSGVRSDVPLSNGTETAAAAACALRRSRHSFNR